MCVFKIYDEPESQHEGACLRYIMMGQNRHMTCVRNMMSRSRQMRGMFKTYDALESRHDLACLRYMLNNNSNSNSNSNSNNNTIYLECLLSTRVCVCVHGMKSTSPGMHQDTIDNPSHRTRQAQVFCASSSEKGRLFKPPCKFASK